MATWIKTDLDFGLSCIIFEVPVRALAACQIRDMVAAKADDLPALAAALEELIRFYRPDLAGGQLVGIEMGRGGLHWQLWYAHPSLPRTPTIRGVQPERQPLIPEGGPPGHKFRQFT